MHDLAAARLSQEIAARIANLPPVHQ